MQCNSVTDAAPSGAADAWAFAVRVYGRPGVREACLGLQDRRGADVVAMLALLHHAARGHPAPRQEAVETLLGEVAAWRRAAVLPLRAIRRELKQAMFPGDIAPGPDAERARQAVAAAELEAERVELGYLARRLAEAGQGEARLTGVALLHRYGQAAGLAFDAADRQDLASLAAAALPDSDGRTVSPEMTES